MSVHEFEEAPTAGPTTPTSAGAGVTVQQQQQEGQEASSPPLAVAVALFSNTLRSVVTRSLTQSGCFGSVAAIAPPPRSPQSPVVGGSDGGGGGGGKESNSNSPSASFPSSTPFPSGLSGLGAATAAAFAASVENAYPGDQPLALVIDAAALGPLSSAVRLGRVFSSAAPMG